MSLCFPRKRVSRVGQWQMGERGSCLASSAVLEKVKRVLLVDPDEAFGNVLEEVLEGEGYRIHQVPSPEAALSELGGCDALVDAPVILLKLHCGTQNWPAHRHL